LYRYAKKFAMAIWAYCLMTNHVHMIVVPRRADSLARAIGNAHRQYSRTMSVKNDWTGHLWANRFYSSPLDEVHMWYAVRYIESNPLRAGLVANATGYRWSSARAHAGMTRDPVLSEDRPFPGSIAGWGAWLNAGRVVPEYNTLRRNTSTGRPTGTADFVDRIEKELGQSFDGIPGQSRLKVAVPILGQELEKGE
jgi:putative transposase